MKTGLHARDTTQGRPLPDALLLRDLARSGLDVKLHLLQQYTELARLPAGEILDDEVGCLCGERYRRDKPSDGRYQRWRSNSGSIRIQHERVPIDVPRLLRSYFGVGLSFVFSRSRIASISSGVSNAMYA